MSRWNPEENYIWIEPNIKYLLRYPDSWKYAPTPWYARPPPQPVKPGPPVDKLRFVSTRRIHNAFKRHTPYVQTVADDLDAFAQTFLHALLARGGADVARVAHLFARYGQEDLHTLGGVRDGTVNVFRNLSERVELEVENERQKERKREELGWDREGGGSTEGTDARQDSNDPALDLKAPVGIDAMSEALYKILHISASQMGKENVAGREAWRWKVAEKQQRERSRAVEHYDKYLEAWARLRQAADLSERRKVARKAEKAKAKADKERKKQELEKTEHVCDEDPRMDVYMDEGNAPEGDGPVRQSGMSSKNNARARSDSEASNTDAEHPPRKRGRGDQ